MNSYEVNIYDKRPDQTIERRHRRCGQTGGRDSTPVGSGTRLRSRHGPEGIVTLNGTRTVESSTRTCARSDRASVRLGDCEVRNVRIRRSRACITSLSSRYFVAPVLVTAQGNLGTYEDRIAVEDVMAALCVGGGFPRSRGLVACSRRMPSSIRTGASVKDTRKFARSSRASFRGATTSGRRDCRLRICTSDQQRAHRVPETRQRLSTSLLADCASRKGWQNDRGREGRSRPTRRAQWQVVDSIAKADRLHRLTRSVNPYLPAACSSARAALRILTRP